MFGDYIEAFHHDLTDVVQFTGVAILVLGFSNFIWYLPPKLEDKSDTDNCDAGYPSKHVSADVRSSFSLRSYASAAVFGEQRQTHTIVSWALACEQTANGKWKNKLMIYRLNGIGAGPAETAQPTIIADVIFLHDRGKYQTLYFAFYFGSLMVTFLFQ